MRKSWLGTAIDIVEMLKVQYCSECLLPKESCESNQCCCRVKEIIKLIEDTYNINVGKRGA